jgi:hypothetical protein
MPAPRCLRCGNTGQVIEVRLTWMKKRVDLPPLSCSRRVDSEAEGRRLARLLGEDAFDIDILTGSTDCTCQNKKEPVPDVPKRVAADWDWKRAQAGDRD